MPKRILIEEFHLTFFAPADLHGKGQNAIQRTLNSPAFQMALRRAALAVTRRYPVLELVTVKLSR